MKNIIIFLFVLGLSAATQAVEPIISYKFGEKVESITNYSSDYYLVNKIELLDDASLSIALAEVSYQSSTQKHKQYGTNFVHIQSVPLTSYQYQMIMQLVAELSVAPLTKIIRTRLCEIVVDEYALVNHLAIKRDWDYGSQSFLSPMEVISTPSGCWIAEEINPRYHRDAANANLLKIILQFIFR